MARLRRQRDSEHQPERWRVCIECGNRYQAADHGYRVNWCSMSCENASFRRQRDEIETAWVRARWFLR